MEDNKKTKNIKLTLYIIGIVCLLIGVSYATYTYILKGSKEHQVNIGSLTLKYEETNNINVNGDTLKTDEEGIVSTNSFNFKVSVNNSTNKKISYIVYLSLDEEYKNNAKVGKVYLNNKTKSITYGPTIITDLSKYKYTNSYVLCIDSFSTNEETHEYELKAWISLEEARNESGLTHETFLGGSVKFKVSIETVESTNLDTSGANAPVLASNMIPVYYDEASTTWKKADFLNISSKYQWYSYESTTDKKGMWANAVTVKEATRENYLNAEVGTEIPMTDINAMWVWIPRFNASLPSNYNGGTAEAPGAIDVTFVSQSEKALDAFTFGAKELTGFWYGKFETGGELTSACTTTTCDTSNIVIKPSVSPLRTQKVSSYFYAARSMEQTGNVFGFVSSEVDTHMSKNDEWGAVTYLTQSIYGKCTSSTTCTEVGINNKNPFLTGHGDVAGSSLSAISKEYNTETGKIITTTGNVYGICDMSGGAGEYVMGVLADSNGKPMSGNTASYNSGFNGTLTNGTSYTNGVAFPESKYYNLYTETSYEGHALLETKAWYNDVSNFVNTNSPWFIRGGTNSAKTGAGIFGYNYYSGAAYVILSFRSVITIE